MNKALERFWARSPSCPPVRLWKGLSLKDSRAWCLRPLSQHEKKSPEESRRPQLY